jgi:serine/threonine protein kinase
MECRGYQPPEYIDRGEISNKFDIFSLGVIMIQIISGPQGYFKYADIPNDEFIDLVRNDISLYKIKKFISNALIVYISIVSA